MVLQKYIFLFFSSLKVLQCNSCDTAKLTTRITKETVSSHPHGEVTTISIFLKCLLELYVLRLLSVCQAMCAQTAALIATKLGQQTLLLASLKMIPKHLRSEAILRPKFVQSSVYYMQLGI